VSDDYKNRMKWLCALLALAALVALGGSRAARADAASPWYVTDHGKARLIAATADPGNAAGVTLGLQFELAPHWKIYWRSPGDAGYPPQLDWTGSTNLRDAAIAWPAPERFSVQGLETVG
jgi:suppressor for copper-sensitivity B